MPDQVVFSYVAYPGQEEFDFDFDYLLPGHINVYVDGLFKTNGLHYELLSAKRIKFFAAMGGGEMVIIARVTSTSVMVDFNSSLADFFSGVRTAYLQTLYLAQENTDSLLNSIILDRTNNVFNAQGNKIINVGTPTDSSDAANKSYVDTFLSGGGLGSDASTLNVTATGSTTPRSLGDRAAGREYDPRDYGALANGVADDAAAINLAITDMLAAGGGTLIIPGRCRVTSTILIQPTSLPPSIGGKTPAMNIRIRGETSSGSILFCDHAGVGLKFDGSLAPSAGCGFQVSNLWILGNLTTSTIGLYGYHCEFHKNVIENVAITGFIDDSMLIDRCWNGCMKNCLIGGDGLTTNNGIRTDNANEWEFNNVYFINTAIGDGKYAMKLENNTDSARIIGCQADNVAGVLYVKDALGPTIVMGCWTEQHTNATPGGGTGEVIGFKFENCKNVEFNSNLLIWGPSSLYIPSGNVTGRQVAIKLINCQDVTIGQNFFNSGGTISLGSEAVDVDSNCEHIIFAQTNRTDGVYRQINGSCHWPRIRENSVSVVRITDLQYVQIPHEVQTRSATQMDNAKINTDVAYVPAVIDLPDPGGQAALAAMNLPKHAITDQTGIQFAAEIQAPLNNVCYSQSIIYCTSGTGTANVIGINMIPTCVAVGDDARGYTQTFNTIPESTDAYDLMYASGNPIVPSGLAKMVNCIVARRAATGDTSSKDLYVIAASLHKFKADWRK